MGCVSSGGAERAVGFPGHDYGLGQKTRLMVPFPLVWEGLWGVGWWFDNWIVDASIHLPVWWVCVCSHTLIALFCGVVGCGVF